jgi:hypothetical protein
MEKNEKRLQLRRHCFVIVEECAEKDRISWGLAHSDMCHVRYESGQYNRCMGPSLGA